MQFNDSPRWRALTWTIRCTVALQCLGNARWFLQIEETPLLSFLWEQPDVGGLGWTEANALGLQHALGWASLGATVFVLLRPSIFVLLPLVLLQLALAVAMVRVHDGFQLSWTWLPVSLANLFLLATQAGRIAAPLAVWILDSRRINGPPASPRQDLDIQFLRAAIAVTFIAHGIEACQHYHLFADFNIVASRRIFTWRLSQSAAESLLTVIGIVDIGAALALMLTRWRWIAGYMAFWGFVTAAARVVAYGWGIGLHEFLTRAPHFGIPLAIALYWSIEQRDEESNYEQA